MFDTVCRRCPEQRFLWVAPTASTAQTPMMVWGRSNRSCRPSKLLFWVDTTLDCRTLSLLCGCLHLTDNLLKIVVSVAPSRPCLLCNTPKNPKPLLITPLQCFFWIWIAASRTLTSSPGPNLVRLPRHPISSAAAIVRTRRLMIDRLPDPATGVSMPCSLCVSIFPSKPFEMDDSGRLHACLSSSTAL